MSQLAEFDSICNELKGVDASVKNSKDPIDRNLYWVDGYVKKGDTSGIEKYTEMAKKQLADAKSTLETSGISVTLHLTN